MAVRIVRGVTDPVLDRIAAQLEAFQADYPDAQVDMYRRYSMIVRVRIVAPSFSPLDLFERNDLVWKYLEPISDDDAGEIGMLVLVTPDELPESGSNFEFVHPAPSALDVSTEPVRA